MPSGIIQEEEEDAPAADQEEEEEEKKKDSEPEVDPILAVWAAEAAAFDALEAKFIAELGLSRKDLPEIWRQAHHEQ